MTDKSKTKISSEDFRVPSGKKVKLKEWATSVKPVCDTKEGYQELLEEHVAELSSLQHLHYASNRYALLLISQGMDGAGKDGAIRHVMSGVNPEGCEVFSFKQPSAEELEHDFLWRTTCRLVPTGSPVCALLYVRVQNAHIDFDVPIGGRRPCKSKSSEKHESSGRAWESAHSI